MLRIANTQLLAWEVRLADGKMFDCRTISPSDIMKLLLERFNFRWWEKKQVEETSEGVWFGPISAF